MQAETMAPTAEFPNRLSVDEVGSKLGLNPTDSRDIAVYLREIGWADVTFQGPPSLRLTLLGFREIAKLRRPIWRKWIDNNPLWMNFFMAVLAGLVVLLGGKIIDAITK